MDKKNSSLLKSLRNGLLFVLVIVVFAYGFQVTDVSFETTRSPDRLTSLHRVLRALVKPEILEYETVETFVEVPFYLPCPEGQDLELPEVDPNEPYLKPSVPCASPKEIITVEGFNLAPNSKGPLSFIAASGIKKPLGEFTTDANGYFRLDNVEIPNRQPVEEAQKLRATTREQVGGPKFTRAAKATWDKIIETVFIALLATTIGTMVSIPISFLAARNLMSEAKSSLTGAALALIGWAIGAWVGMTAAHQMVYLLTPFSKDIPIPFLASILIPTTTFFLVRWIMPAEDIEQPPPLIRAGRVVVLILAGVAGIATFIMVGFLGRNLGSAMVEPLGNFGFIGNFIYQLGETAAMVTSIFAALAGGAAIGGMTGKFGQSLNDRLSGGVVKTLNLIFTALAGAMVFALAGAAIDWFYQIGNLVKTFYWPAGIGASLGLLLALWSAPKKALPTGLVFYFIIRTILNATRSVEPLVMAIVFVIWVGIGPFAGSLALALHTIAALAKLYSEQVESILPGPLEAIQATGANRLQTIMYAVVPQIVPPYISFTMYRWDINVRMSTIIGFVGGGGIGFLLQQNINLLNYRAASVQMLAIAVVVALMDYISSKIRERLV